MASSLTTIQSSRTIAISKSVISICKETDLKTIIKNYKKEGTKLLRLQFLERSRFRRIIRSIRLRRLNPVSIEGKTPFRKEDFLKAVQDDAFIEKMRPNILSSYTQVSDSGKQVTVQKVISSPQQLITMGRYHSERDDRSDVIAAMDQKLKTLL